MILIYSALVAVLGTFAWAVRKQYRSIEAKYMSQGETIMKLANPLKGGTNKSNTQDAAINQFRLGSAIAEGERLERLHATWGNRLDKLNRVMRVLTAGPKKISGYVGGKVDAVLTLVALQIVGVIQVIGVPEFDRLVAWCERVAMAAGLIAPTI